MNRSRLNVFEGLRQATRVVLPLLLGCVALSNGVRAQKAPNILFLFADDQCYETIRAFGHTDIETPNLDRLAKRGMAFTHCYNMGSYSGAVCVASRTMLNTGRFLWHAQRLHKKSEQERKAGRFWAEYLKKAGYETYMSGKWHVTAKARLAFDHTVHIRGGMPKQTKAGYNRPIDGQEDPWSPYDPKFGGFWQGGKHWSEVLADDAEGFLKQAAKRDKPFFMYLAFNAPHDPRQAPKSYVDKYPLDRIALPKNFLAEYPFKDDIGCSARLRDERLAPFPRTERAIKVNRQEYYAIVTHMDAQIGRILKALERTGKADNTWIFFTADHGLGVGHHGLLGKQNLYDHSVRVPFLVSGPGVKPGTRSATPIYLQDLMPTTLELAKVDKPEHVQFHSLLPLIRGGADRPGAYEAIYGGYLAVQRSVVKGKHKLILYPKIQRARLYDLAADPHEMEDLAGREQYGPLMKELFAELLKLQPSTGDELDLTKSFKHLL
ncbi:MAG: sulfatase-like hydrolase/transferase [Planctomycetota bacterium]|nr:sulfatase-like hydrolase/transferase [Planctomycetota bacterium]